MEKAEAGKFKFICFTDEGCKLMNKLRLKAVQMEGFEELSDSKRNAKDNDEIIEAAKVKSLSEWTKENFSQGNVLVFIGAVGIAVRAIAPFCKDKTTDPAVIVIDERGEFVIPILSGHIGGGVSYARELASFIRATPVITTATDVRDEFAVDVFAKENDLSINDMKLAKKCSATLLAGEETEFTVTPKAHKKDKLYLIPRCTVVGMGCRKGKSFDELNEFLQDTLSNLQVDIRSLKAIVSVDKKKDEEGLLELASFYDVSFITYSSEALMEQTGDFEHSDLVMEVTGADNVCERSVAAYGCHKIVQKKLSKGGMTIAIGMSDVVLEY